MIKIDGRTIEVIKYIMARLTDSDEGDMVSLLLSPFFLEIVKDLEKKGYTEEEIISGYNYLLSSLMPEEYDGEIFGYYPDPILRRFTDGEIGLLKENNMISLPYSGVLNPAEIDILLHKLFLSKEDAIDFLHSFLDEQHLNALDYYMHARNDKHSFLN
ncbi:MAG: hypothetical protein DRP50_00460 [Thermotoga sp.]|nr:hypothetical protein [Thermotogota bacterium]RKX56376.1 MAG: hypothetical protein DRP50_00460 [Thermotoga sp.]